VSEQLWAVFTSLTLCSPKLTVLLTHGFPSPLKQDSLYQTTALFTTEPFFVPSLKMRYTIVVGLAPIRFPQPPICGGTAPPKSRLTSRNS
jgi:hypothetical protein